MIIGSGLKAIIKEFLKDIKFQIRKIFGDAICNDKCPYLDRCHSYVKDARCCY